MRYREIAQKLRRLGCYPEQTRRTSGSHRKWVNPDNGLKTPIPDWRGYDLRIGTIRAVVRQFGLDWREFNEA